MSKTKRRLYNFNLSHNNNTTMQMGKLYPVSCVPTLPGDSYRFSSSAFVRASPMLKPVMHPIRIEFKHFYVPDRILWDECEAFHTGGEAGMETPDPPHFSVPVGSHGIFPSRSLGDYFGFPISNGVDTVKGEEPIKISSLPFRAYQKIWNYYFRDQDLQDEIDIPMTSGADSVGDLTTLRRVCWEKDYLSVSRPWAQKGPAVALNIGDITLDGSLNLSHNHTNNAFVNFSGSSSINSSNSLSSYGTDGFGGNSLNKIKGSVTTSTGNSLSNGIPVNVTGQAGQILATDFRWAFQLQSYLEELARTGNRYDDVLRSTFGVKIRNDYIQEPIYIGGDRQTLQISEVLQTSPTDTGALGDYAGHGVGALGSGRYFFRAPEWGHIITLMYIRPDAMYMQGLNRLYTKEVREEYYNPFFALVGQQHVTNKEVTMFHNDPNNTWGFADRYDEYRIMPNIVTGEFRIKNLGMDWHLARELPTDVALNSSFVSCVPSNRIFAEQSGDYDHFYCMVRNKIQALRPVVRNPRPRLGM